MKIISKIYIHPLTYLVILVSLCTGLFRELVTFLFIIIIHELGHIIGALIYKWHIEKIVIMPFGGIIIFHEFINRPLKEEFIIMILGPLFQLINFIIFKDVTLYFNYYNYGLFIFNMLPIYPLDGYKLYSILLNKIIPFKLTLKIMLIISFIFLILFIRKDLIYICILIFLLIGIIKEYSNIDFIYNKFLLERYYYNFGFKKRRIISNINNMYKDYIHLIRGERLLTEKEVLEKKYSNLTK